mgnify:CR=1 FL=1
MSEIPERDWRLERRVKKLEDKVKLLPDEIFILVLKALEESINSQPETDPNQLTLPIEKKLS